MFCLACVCCGPRGARCYSLLICRSRGSLVSACADYGRAVLTLAFEGIYVVSATQETPNLVSVVFGYGEPPYHLPNGAVRVFSLVSIVLRVYPLPAPSGDFDDAPVHLETLIAYVSSLSTAPLLVSVLR